MKVIDNFIADQQLLSAVRNDNSFFPESMGEGERIAEQLNSYHYQDSSVYSPYMFWDGWWKSPANTLKKKVIRAIWEKNLDYPLEDIVGFEYWTRTFAPGQVLSPHVDEDTFLYEENKTFGGPITGCVYYGEHNPDGGFLEIHKSVLADGEKNALERENIESLFSPTEDLERIAYRGNRLVIFDTGHVLHGTTPAKSGTRQVMVVNVWHKNNPPRGLVLNKFAYEALDQTQAIEPTQFSLKVKSPLGTDDYNVEQLKMLLTEGRQTLFVFTEGEKIIGALSAEVISYPNNRVVHTSAVGGKGIFDENTIKQYEDWARSQGATKIRAFAKDAQARLYKIKMGLTEKLKTFMIKFWKFLKKKTLIFLNSITQNFLEVMRLNGLGTMYHNTSENLIGQTNLFYLKTDLILILLNLDLKISNP